ncbi:MAG: fatty acid desaturase [Pirellulales bacterium]
MNPNAYVVVEYPAPHPDRARTIMAEHPEVRSLFGYNRWSGVAILAIVAVQLVVGAWLTPIAWWIKAIVAFCFGAYCNHALWVLVHECTHNLVYRSRAANRWMAILANLPMFFPMTVTFSVHHIKHHKYLGDYHNDADVANRWEAWLFRRGPLGRLAWQCLFPVFQLVRTFWLESKNQPSSWTKWLWVNVAVQLSFLVGFFWLLGPGSLLYFVFSAFFSVGPHPLGARWIQEHYVFREGQETYSYYGGLNHLAFNIGYHNEHHDLPQIPWNRLPALKKAVPEMYDGLHAHYSWTKLWLKFLFDAKFDFFRIARADSGRSLVAANEDKTNVYPLIQAG